MTWITWRLQRTETPASDFWPLQGRETALFGGVALILIAFAAWWTDRAS